jgi:hypothetical protein
MVYLNNIYQFNGKPILPTKAAMDELSSLNLDLHDVSLILNEGFQLRKRKKNVIEKALNRGNKMTNVVIIDMASYYKLIHAGEFTLTKKFRKLMKNGLR